MNYPRKPELIALGLLLAAAAARAQTAPAAPPPAPATSATPVPAPAGAGSAADSDQELVTLPAFSISAQRDASYVGTSSLSSTRIAVDLLELPQSVKVLNQSFLSALNVSMASDILDYVGGGQNGQLNWTPGRMNIRGFTGDADYVDGFSPTAATALDDAIYERFEVVKGPSTIFLAADGSPGGIVNKISKSPSATPETSLTLQTGNFDGNKATLDSAGPITRDGKLQYRAVISQSYYNGYYDNVYMHRLTSLFALSYQFTPNSKLTVKGQITEANWPSYNGLPVDPRTHYVIDLPNTATQDFDAPLDWRHDNVHRVWGEYTNRLNQYLALSVRGMRAFDRADRHESIAPTWSEGTSTGTALINGVSTPVTFLGGKWTNPATVGTSESVAPVHFFTQNGTTFVTDSWAGTPTYAGGAIPRSTINADDAHTTYNDVQADLNFNYSSKYFTELLLVGGEHRDQPGETETWKTGVSASPWFPYAQNTPGSTVVNYTTPSAYQQTVSLQNRGYALETLKFWDDRIIASYGVSRASNFSSTWNRLTNAYQGVPYHLNANLIQYGLVLKVLPGVSLFTGFNENFAVNGTGTLNGVPNSVLPPKTGKQHEVGIKTDLLNHRLTFDVSYFDIQQQNNTVPSFPSDPLNPNVLIPGVVSRGFDGDWTFKFTSQLYLMGSWANYSAKSVLGAAYAGAQGGRFIQPGTGTVAWASIPVDNTAEQTESVYALYRFEGQLRGLQIGLGENMQSKRAITDGPNQVFWGYVPGRTLVDLSAQYQYNPHVRFNMTVDNLMNAKYIYAVRSEDIIVPGMSANLKFAVTYTF
ncbi:MAG TPA: TonB-dependent receptor [Opitutaceae bacterium]|nr:TonB-dependent receptor [Opitutaceae bacterium]